ncbi:ADP-ribosylglycohydrolase family protein [Sedimentibacter sp. B4]|uniref:ADP-ribosylglycohydrolase family protein n=1 Tax=Sedimentibacter sp. B4 TaxID=304766 RepID=UPI0002D90652|nr:ADP-ribosylglycohydrolase family protein [Sedimentibacter sp. B4]
MNNKKDKFIASLLGGAIGDALGYAVEFMLLDEIIDKYGSQGISDLDIDKEEGKALISDDTQMTLFTANGILMACKSIIDYGNGSYIENGIYQSYLQWYYTQNSKFNLEKRACFQKNMTFGKQDNIMQYKKLFVQRAPGISCLSALESNKMGTIEHPINDSKGCGGVMRVAPIGLFFHNDTEYAFSVGAEAAALTHGHPTGYLAAGVFASIIAELVNCNNIIDGTLNSIRVLKTYSNHEETLNAIMKAIDLSNSNEKTNIAISKLGEGWVAEEALAIALYCSLKEKDFIKSLIMSVNHDGDSDSTGSICGNILGACYGIKALPKDWANKMELKELILNMSNKLYDVSVSAGNSIYRSWT